MQNAVFSCSMAVLISCGTDSPQNQAGHPDSTQVNVPVENAEPFYAGDLFTLSDAEAIMGEPSHLSDSSSYQTEVAYTFQNSYTANRQEDGSEKTGVIYFMFQEFITVEGAIEDYAFIREGNMNNGGFEDLSNLGDEAYFHTDNENFLFILVRKSNRSFRMKVNKITANTSREEFDAVSKKITDAL
jgi:hypothetical protein